MIDGGRGRLLGGGGGGGQRADNNNNGPLSSAFAATERPNGDRDCPSANADAAESAVSGDLRGIRKGKPPEMDSSFPPS